jgi:type III pantothenate kinase
MMENSQWLAVTIGNTHGRIGEFFGNTLTQVHCLTHAAIAEFLTAPQKYLSPNFAALVQGLNLEPNNPDSSTKPAKSNQAASKLIRLASVVPELTLPWRDLPSVACLSLGDLPLKGMYPTLGIDRALAAWGAGQRYGFPVLVIDGGTALTFTAVDHDHNFLGGAILPGLNTQFRSLHTNTAALPLIQLPNQLPELWGKDTASAIQSGVIHTVIASVWTFTHQWQQQFPDGTIVFTGGDGPNLYQWFQQWLARLENDQSENPQNDLKLYLDPDLVLRGMMPNKTEPF